MAEYLQQHIGQTFEAVISGVTEWGLFAEIIENHCEGLLRLADIRGDRWVFFEKEKKVKGQRTRREFKIGDIIQIRVKNANPQLRMIDFSLV
jgi:ribonuclease R